MSHELHAMKDGRYLDNNLVDDSYRILTAKQVDATFSNKNWRDVVMNKDCPYTVYRARQLARGRR
jgi:hypothetical protein